MYLLARPRYAPSSPCILRDTSQHWPTRAAKPWAAHQYGVRMADVAMTHEVTIVPANEASWEDLQAVLGTRGDPT